ncbi:MAG: FAD-dependent oxidoreductase [Acidobacteriota bacterium]|nr:FAD-dependent oxidoreductase [Acidobacteriota bacterium]
MEANRCLNCFDAPCTAACPTHIDVPRFIKKIATHNLRGAAVSILEANVLAASCARVCPVEVLCEGACVLHHQQQEPIAIGRLQRFAMDTFYAAGGRIPQRKATARSQSVACIGGGPASLACAAELRQQGFAVTIYERRALPGGLNSYGVAQYKLRTADSLREIEQIRALGVTFATREIATEADLKELESSYDAIFLGVGLGAMHKLGIAGDGAPCLVDALEFIESYKLGRREDVGSHVVVIGAGNTAIDAAIAARRLGAQTVSVLYRRGPQQVSAFDFEIEHARHEGVTFLWGTLPIAIHHAPEDERTTLECTRVEVNRHGDFVLTADSNFTLECDLIIPAIGQSPLLTFLQRVRGLQIEKGRVVIDRASGQTTHPRYFAGGDCVNGGREVVDAVADGKRAACGIAAALGTAKEASHG